MKEFWFIRHGESETNAGLASESDASTPLTEKGRAQAKYLSNAILIAPDLFIVSPYMRTKKTAESSLAKFPNVPVETWDIHEFSYLSHDQYRGAATRERRKLSMAYFRKGNPDLALGKGAESFNEFISRVENCFQKLIESNHARIVLFGHGWFIRAGLWHLITQAENTNEKAAMIGSVQQYLPTEKIPMKLFKWLSRQKRHKQMNSFLLFSSSVSTPNCSIIKYRVTDSSRIQLSGYATDHLPENLLVTSLKNR